MTLSNHLTSRDVHDDAQRRLGVAGQVSDSEVKVHLVQIEGNYYCAVRCVPLEVWLQKPYNRKLYEEVVRKRGGISKMKDLKVKKEKQ